MPILTVGTTTISYVIEERPRRQHPAIQVDAQRQVKVLLPPHFPEGEIVGLLHRHADWIVKHVSAPPRAPSIAQKQFVSGEEFSLQGDCLQLEVLALPRKAVGVTQDGQILRVTIPEHTASDHQPLVVRELLIRWFYHQAVAVLPQRMEHYSAVVGVRAERLKISEYKSRWGFCREDGLIALNWRIIQAPPPMIDYVVVHELTHRRHPHHQKAFWEAVAVVLPDYGMRKQWLKDHGSELAW